MDCIFCGIVSGRVPSVKVHEDDKTLAFMDAFPAAAGHTLVVPKAHSSTILDLSDEDVTSVIRTVKSVAKAIYRGLEPDGLNVLQANGLAAGQSVNHFHFHLVPRALEDGLRIHLGGSPMADATVMEQTAQKIRAAL